MKYARILTSLFVVLSIATTVSAHPGRTDSMGGHYDRSTGEYHYHHGYPAHQHTGGVCPYDFDDKTGQNSGGASAGKREDAPKKEEQVEKKSEKKDGIFSKIGLAVISGFAVLYILLFLGLPLVGCLCSAAKNIAVSIARWFGRRGRKGR